MIRDCKERRNNWKYQRVSWTRTYLIILIYGSHVTYSRIFVTHATRKSCLIKLRNLVTLRISWHTGINISYGNVILDWFGNATNAYVCKSLKKFAKQKFFQKIENKQHGRQRKLRQKLQRKKYYGKNIWRIEILIQRIQWTEKICETSYFMNGKSSVGKWKRVMTESRSLFSCKCSN